jgi:hypothetical protein
VSYSFTKLLIVAEKINTFLVPATEGILFHIMALLTVCLVLIKFKHLKFAFNIFNKQ